ncbi:MAG: ABC transporter permease [Anaerolineae bacterium]|nr:ABC transporter permease [Anaerolineae bacterium]
MIDQLLQTHIIIGVLATGVRLSTPFLLAALGEMFTQRSGVFNLGVEGIMLMGAFSGFWVTLVTGTPMLGILAAIIVGALMGLLMAFVSVTMQAKQGISGIGLYMLGWGLAGFLFRITVGYVTSVEGFRPIAIPILSDIPILGTVLFNHNWMVYFSLLLVPISWVVLFKTTWGLKVRAVGVTPEAADTLGVSVRGIRYACVVIGSIMAGLAGAFLTLGHTNMYGDNLTAGRGFIAVALVYFGRWNPWGILAGSLFFSIVDALQLWVQVLGLDIPYEFAVMAPYVLTVVALAAVSGRIWEPAALGKPFDREA